MAKNTNSELLTLTQINLLDEFSNFTLQNLLQYITDVGLQKHYIQRLDGSKIVAYKKSQVDKLRVK